MSTNKITCYGIDLGTTNSSLAIVDVSITDDGIPHAEIIEVPQPTPSGEKISAIIPSMVAIYEGKEWIGEGAREVRNLAYDPSKRIIRNQSLFYDTKNEIGTSRKYRGLNGIKNPVDVATRVLKFICEKGIESDFVDNVVVTVPASFQSKQREDTMKACQLAGLNINGHRLLDEPCAAFIDYASRHDQSLLNFGENKNLLVFDFGGGTCDIAIFELSKNEGVNSSINTKSLSVSRYHRLGGGDIDLAIIHKVLIPALLKENNLSSFDIDFDEQQAIFVPALTSIAESLKIQISNQIWRLKQFKQYIDKKDSITAMFPSAIRIKSIRLRKELTLSPESTVLTVEQFEDILKPFLTTSLLTPNLKEDRVECSMFAPIEDGLERSNLDYNDIDYVFAVGGSSLIQQFIEKLEEDFPKSKIITFEDRKDFQYAIARGAALQAWSLTKFGKGLIQPIIQDDLYLQVENGDLKLIEKGSSLPFPNDDWAMINAIAVPQNTLEKTISIDFKFVAGMEKRLIGHGVMEGIRGVPQGTRIVLKYKFDENQVFHAYAKLQDFEESAELHLRVENPISNIVNPNKQIEERDLLLEELQANPDSWEEILPDLARACAKLGYYKQAITYLKNYQRRVGEPNTWALNLQAIYEERRGNNKAAIECYEAAANVDDINGIPCFNLALAMMKSDDCQNALVWVNKALNREDDAPFKVLRLQIQKKLGYELDYIAEAKKIIGEFNKLEVLDNWEFYWYETASNIVGDDTAKQKIEDEKTRRRNLDEPVSTGTNLPIIIESTS